MSEIWPEPCAPPRDDAVCREVDLLLLNADWVVTCDPETGCIRRGAAAIRGDTLEALGPTALLRRQFRGRREMNLQGHVLIPGLINTHCHGAMSCLRGLKDDLPLDRWLREVIFPIETAVMTEETVYWGTLLSAVEMIKNGITTVCDGYFYEEAAARAILDSGMRGVLGQGILDFPTPDCPDPGQSQRRAESFLDSFPVEHPRLRPALFCHAPYTCSPKTLTWAKALCRERGILFQTHLSETASEVRDLTDLYGQPPVFHLDRLGILDEWTLCVHGIWLSSQEIDLLVRRGAGISHNPESNMKLASGVCPLTEFLYRGAPVGLGTDGCAGNNDLDLFSEMDRAAKLEKVFRLDPTSGAAVRIFELATASGARVLRWEDELGSLKPGKKADLVAVDFQQPHLTPVYDPISHLVYAVKGSDVRHVWVNGRQVLADRHLVGIDEVRVMEEVRKVGEQVRHIRSGGSGS